MDVRTPILRPIAATLIMVLLVTSCAPGGTVPLDRRPGKVTEYEGKHRIQMKDGSEYIAHTFTVSDSLVVIKWLDSSDPRFATTARPISLPVPEVSKVEDLARTPTKLGLVIMVGCGLAVVGLSLWIFGQFISGD
jgi:hypothetical protein